MTHLGLVLDEVNLGLAGLRRGLCGNDNLGLLLGLLDQNVDQSLLLVLRNHWDNWGSGRRWGRRLDEHDFVVLLWRRHLNRLPVVTRDGGDRLISSGPRIAAGIILLSCRV